MKSLVPLVLSATLLASCSQAPKKETPAEKTPAPQSAAASNCAAYQGKPAPKTFAEFDVDGNKQISHEEFICLVIKHFGRINVNRDSYIDGKELKGLGKAQARADIDGDKKVTLPEFMETASGAFVAFDEDKSGTLSETEFAAGLKAIQQ